MIIEINKNKILATAFGNLDESTLKEMEKTINPRICIGGIEQSIDLKIATYLLEGLNTVADNIDKTYSLH